MRAAKGDTTPFGGYGGDEDQGQMGALNALMALGLFNLRGGCEREPILELSTPIFDRITIHLDPEYHGGGSFVVETLFAIPGMGQWFVKGAINRDYSMVLGTAVLYFGLVSLLNLLVDLAYAWLDPRLRDES